MADQTTRWFSNHDGGYYVCKHRGCSKKARPDIPDHDCCGRCLVGRDCLSAALNSYTGPGGFLHNYFETVLRPGACDICGLGREGHPVR